MFFQPPFPPTEVEAEAITNIGFMFADILIMLIFIILMIYLYRKINDILPIIVVYLFSLLIGIEGLTHIHTHFSPSIELFFLLFQTSIFVLAAVKTFKTNKKNWNND